MEASGAFYRQVVEAAPDGIWVVDLRGRTLYANPRTAELLGRTVEEMHRISVHDALDEAGRAQLDEHLRRVATTGPNPGTVECTYRRPDGTSVPLAVSEGAVLDDEGRLVGLSHRLSDDAERQSLVAELTRSREQLAEAQAIARMGSYDLDLTTGTLEWSEEMYRIFGTDPATFVPSVDAFRERVLAEDLPVVDDAVGSGREVDLIPDLEVRVPQPDGSVVWLRGRSRATYDAAGHRVRLQGTLQDVTDLKDAEAQLLDAVVLNALLQVLLTAANASATLEEALRALRRHLLGHEDWSRVVVLEVRDGSTVRPRLVPCLAEEPAHQPDERERRIAERVLASRTTVYEHSRTGLPSASFPVVLDGEPLVVVVITSTGPFRRLSMVRSLVAQVSDQLTRVAERERTARELAAARDAAMEASRLKSDFLATMSHEIRTPMNGVIGLNELLLRSGLDPEQRRLAEGVQRAGHTLLGIINDILDFSKIEAGELELERVPFDLRATLEGSASLLGSRAADKGLELSVRLAEDLPERVVGDPTRLGQILSNLLSNAVTFTGSGSVRLTAEVAERTGEAVVLRVEVADTGVGIDAEQRERLFEPFRQADASTTRTHGGTGLGLAIVRQLVSRFGGEVGVESEPGTGSCFWFTAAFALPPEHAAVSPAHRAEAPSTDPPAAARGRVLVVEDNDINQLVALGLLEALGYTGEVAGNGAEAVALLARHEYDAVLMDLQMPVMDGFTASRRIRASERDGVRVPIIAMTASAITGERDRCLAAGMDDFLSKPVSSEQLATALSAHVEPAPAGETSAVSDALDPRRLDELLAMGERAVPIIERAIGNFVANFPGTVAELRSAVDAGDPGTLRAVAHRLKGSALNLGVTRVAEISFALEQQGDEEDLSTAGADVDALQEAGTDALAALAAYRSRRGQG